MRVLYTLIYNELRNVMHRTEISLFARKKKNEF